MLEPQEKDLLRRGVVALERIAKIMQDNQERDAVGVALHALSATNAAIAMTEHVENRESIEKIAHNVDIIRNMVRLDTTTMEG